MAGRLVRVLFGHEGGPARSGDGPAVEKLTNKLLVRAYKAFSSIKLTHAQQLSEAKVHREHGVAWLLADLSFKASATLPERVEAEKAGKRVGTHLGGEKGVVKRLDKINAVHNAAENAAKSNGSSELQLASALMDIAQQRHKELSVVEDTPYILIKELVVLSDDDVGGADGPAAAAGRREYEAEQREASYSASQCIQMLLDSLRSPVEDFLKSKQTGFNLTLNQKLDSTTRPIWREVCEHEMLARGLIEREMLELLRDRDADVEYWQQDSQQKSQQLAVAAREIQALERQVIALGGTLDPYRTGPPVAEAPELDSFEGGRGYGACERAGSSVLHASGAM